jgi:hypothetical protein
VPIRILLLAWAFAGFVASADLLKNLRARRYSTATTNRALIILRHMFNLGRHWKIPGCLPCAKIAWSKMMPAGAANDPEVGAVIATDWRISVRSKSFHPQIGFGH